MAKIGVFVCDCGKNIARTVDTPDVAEWAKQQAGVEFVEKEITAKLRDRNYLPFSGKDFSI